MSIHRLLVNFTDMLVLCVCFFVRWCLRIRSHAWHLVVITLPTNYQLHYRLPFDCRPLVDWGIVKWILTDYQLCFQWISVYLLLVEFTSNHSVILDKLSTLLPTDRWVSNACRLHYQMSSDNRQFMDLCSQVMIASSMLVDFTTIS